jgi:phage FluMu protein gp41
MAALSDFEQIHNLKIRKEEQAMAVVRAARMTLEQAARAVELARQEAEAFSQELLRRQAEMYDNMQGKVVERRAVEDVREEIARLRLHEQSLYKKIEEAEAHRVKMVEALDAAKALHLQAVKNVEKFRQLVDIEHQEIADEEQASEDKEMEEFIRLGEPAEA